MNPQSLTIQQADDVSAQTWRGLDANPKFLKALEKNGDLGAVLVQNQDYGAGIFETETHIAAWVDHVASKPVFYAKSDGILHVSFDAESLREQLGLTEEEEDAVLEFAMAGFIAGGRTLYKDLRCLQPGEYLVFDKTKKNLITKRYYIYKPTMTGHENEVDNMAQLGRILDDVTLKIIRRAAGRKIWIPLSAGLDSRIILCKLHEHGCQNIETFTYGPRWNFEALFAKKIAKTLGLKWQMITLPKVYLRKVFDSQERKDFWRYASGSKAIPCMREFSAVKYLVESGQAKDGDIFINGQSGDYITGAHLPPVWEKKGDLTLDDFYQAIFSKHYGLWPALKTKENLSRIKKQIDDVVEFDMSTLKTKSEICAAYENWEYDARQVCYVINGQRDYEFFGFDWEMPLWEKALVDFYEHIPLSQKWNQNLYKKYLCSYNYKGLFPQKEPYLWRWPIPMLWVVPLARAIGLLGGKAKKDKFYAFMNYFGHYHNQWLFYDFDTHKNFFNKIRNNIALYLRTWFKENDISVPEDVKAEMGLEKK